MLLSITHDDINFAEWPTDNPVWPSLELPISLAMKRLYGYSHVCVGAYPDGREILCFQENSEILDRSARPVNKYKMPKQLSKWLDLWYSNHDQDPIEVELDV